MNVYIGTNELKNAYIGEYKEGIFENPAFNTNTLIAKSGYKIKKLIMEGYIQGKTSGVTYVFKTYASFGGTVNGDVVISLASGSMWSSGNSIYRAVSYDYPSSTAIAYIPASATTSSNSAFRVEFNESSFTVQAGNTYGNWLFTQTYSYTSQAQSNINAIFNSSESTIRPFSNQMNWCKATVIYEKI